VSKEGEQEEMKLFSRNLTFFRSKLRKHKRDSETIGHEVIKEKKQG
jgi:hypothetical protein